MSYIKMKKIWKKHDKLNEKDAEALFELTKKFSPVKKWDDTDFVDVVGDFGQFVHPETDVTDDSEGIQPKQLVEILDIYKKDTFVVLERLIPILNSYIPRNIFDSYVSDGFISWKQVFKNVVIPNLSKDIDLSIGTIMFKLSPALQRFNNIEKEVLKGLGAETIKEERINAAIQEKKVDFNCLKLEVLDDSIFLKKRKELWEKENGRAPQADVMLHVNPHNFSPELLDKVNELYGGRQIAKLSDKEQYHVALLIDNLGLNFLSIPVNVLKTTYSSLSFGNDKIEDYRLVFDKIFKDLNQKDGNIVFVKNLLNVLKSYPLFKDFILKQQNLKDNNMEIILYISNVFNSIKDKKIVETLSSLDPLFFRIFMRYGVLDLRHISSLMKLYNDAQKVKGKLPLVKGSVGKYDYLVLDKSDPLGLVLGYATDCCQVIGGNGQSCLYDGYLTPEASFFVVLKNDCVYAQSWVWSRKDTDYGTGFCFDSLEILGKDVDRSPEILGCYKEAAKQLKKDFDVVYIGADGNCMPDGMEKLGKRLDIDTIYKKNLHNPNKNVYSDLVRDDGGCFILEK